MSPQTWWMAMVPNNGNVLGSDWLRPTSIRLSAVVTGFCEI